MYIKTSFDVDYTTTRRLCPMTKGLTEFEQLLVCYAWMMTDLNYDLLGNIFGGMHRNYIGVIINRWMEVIGERGGMIFV